LGFKDDKDRLVRYLLGDLAEADHQRLEKECLADDKLGETLSAIENDLIDAYVCGELSEKQRQQFEQNFLDTPEKHEQLEVARLLMNPAVRQRVATTAIQSRQERRSWWQSLAAFLGSRHLAMRLAKAAAGIAMAAVAVLLVVQNQRLRTQVSQLQSGQTELHQQIVQLQQRIANARWTGEKDAGDRSGAETLPPLVTVSALLKPGLPRQGGSGSGNSPLTIPAIASSVVLMLDLQTDRYAHYSVVLETAEGETVRRVQGLRSKSVRGGRIIQVHLPSKALHKGDYIVTLSGQETNSPPQVVDSYSFSVIR